MQCPFLPQLALPLFVIGEPSAKRPVPSLPGHFYLGTAILAEEARRLFGAGIQSVVLFGVPDKRDAKASAATAEDSLIARAIQKIKDAEPRLTVVTDICVCQYTDHSHCRILDGESFDLAATMDALVAQALLHAKAGVDAVMPSAVLDSSVSNIRKALSRAGFDTPVISQGVKFASACYGPFRRAAFSKPELSDKRRYQLDPANAEDAIKQAASELEEGAESVMVKPSLFYLDIISRIRDAVTERVSAFCTSAEYTMLKAQALLTGEDERSLVTRACRRILDAGAQLLVTYHARLLAGLPE